MSAKEITTAPVHNAAGVGAQKRTSGMAMLQKFGSLAACALLVGVVTSANPAFVSPVNVFNMVSQWAPAGIMAIGMTVLIIIGGFDLSIASSYSLCAVVAAMLGQHYPPVLAFAGAVLTGAIVGASNALLVVGMRINAYIATVGSGFVVTGISLVLTQNTAVVVSDPTFGLIGSDRWHGLPISGLLMLAIGLIAAFVLMFTVIGHMVYAVGGNAEASRLAGLPVAGISAGAYTFLGICCGIAGFICASQLSSAQSTIDNSILFDVFTIVILGGTSFGGGVGSIWQTAVGLVTVATISNGFVMLNINPFYQSLFKGIIIVGALAIDAFLKGTSSRRGGISWLKWRSQR